MTKQAALEQIVKIAIEIAKTGNFARRSEMHRLACDNEIFLIEDDDKIVIEDDVIYFTF